MLWELRVRQPMLPLSLFKRRNFSVTNIETFAVYGGLSAWSFFLAVFLQQIAGYSAFETGLATLPVTLALFGLSRYAGRLSMRYAADDDSALGRRSRRREHLLRRQQRSLAGRGTAREQSAVSGRYGAFSAYRGTPSSGIGSHVAAYATNCRCLGVRCGSSSSDPMRTLRIAPSGLRLKSAPPHSEQKHLSAPPSDGRQHLTRLSPCTMRSEPGATLACADAAVPVRRWQRVQWQYVIAPSGSRISKRTPPQRQPPVIGAADTRRA